MVTNTNDIHEEIKCRINREMHVTIHLRKNVCLPAHFWKNWELIHIKQLYYKLYCLVVKLGLSALREEERFRVFENKVLRKIFAAKRDEVTEEKKKKTCQAKPMVFLFHYWSPEHISPACPTLVPLVLPYFEEQKRGHICQHLLLTMDCYDDCHCKYPCYNNSIYTL